MSGPILDQFARELRLGQPTGQYFMDSFATKTTTCTRRIQFCSGHRLLGHESKCSHLHGHNYVAFITCEAKTLDGVGRVIDFSCIKEVVGGWIDMHWDHGFILNEKDPNVRIIKEADLGIIPAKMVGTAKGIGKITTPEVRQQKLYLMDRNPTAENMAAYLLHIGNEILPKEVRVIKVVLFETENCYAEVTAEGK